MRRKCSAPVLYMWDSTFHSRVTSMRTCSLVAGEEGAALSGGLRQLPQMSSAVQSRGGVSLGAYNACPAFPQQVPWDLSPIQGLVGIQREWGYGRGCGIQHFCWTTQIWANDERWFVNGDRLVAVCSLCMHDPGWVLIWCHTTCILYIMSRYKGYIKGNLFQIDYCFTNYYYIVNSRELLLSG